MVRVYLPTQNEKVWLSRQNDVLFLIKDSCVMTEKMTLFKSFWRMVYIYYKV